MKATFSFQVDTYSRVTCVTGVTRSSIHDSEVTPIENGGVTGVTSQGVTHVKVTPVTPKLHGGVTGRNAADAKVTPATPVTRENTMTNNFSQVTCRETTTKNTRLRSFLEIEKAELFQITKPDQPSRLGVCISLLGKLHDKAMARGNTDTALELEQIFNELEKAQGADTAVCIAEQILESIAIRQERLKAA